MSRELTQKQWCQGAGRLAPLKKPTSLVDCPTCLRKNLGATRRVDGQYLDNVNPNLTYGTVPPHTATSPRPEQIPEQQFVSATWERDLF